MARMQVSINIEHDVWQIARLKFPGKLSHHLNEYLKHLINKTENEEIDPEIEKRELELKIAKIKTRISLIEANEQRKQDEEDDAQTEENEKFTAAWRNNNPLRFM